MTMHNPRHTLVAILLLFGLFSSPPLVAQTLGTEPANGSYAYSTHTGYRSGEQLDLNTVEFWQNTLSGEERLLDKQASRQYRGLQSLINKAIWVFGVLFTGAVGLLVWFFGKSRQDFQKLLGETFERQAKDIVKKEADRLRQRYETLQAEVEDLTAYKRRSVTWVAKPDDALDTRDAAQEAMLRAFRAMGLQSITALTPSPDSDFALGDPDLVILSFDGTNESKALLKALVPLLKDQAPPVPLLIYTFSTGDHQVCLEQEDLETLSGFHWYIPVNFPAQLLAQTQLLVRRSRNVLGGFSGDL